MSAMPPKPTAANWPSELKATWTGLDTVVTGEPGAWVSDPPEPTENIDTVLSPMLATATSPPPGLNATLSGMEPVVNGEPGASVSVPPAETAMTATFFMLSSVTASRSPLGLQVTDIRAPPTPGRANADPTASRL